MTIEEAGARSSRRIVHRAAALLIGDELLSGKIADQNLHPLAQCLWSLGIRLTRSALVSDDVGEIAGELARLCEDNDLVVTSGGVGPTHDDRTLEAVALALGRRCAPNAELEALIRGVYGDNTTSAHLRMASVPEGTELRFQAQSPWPAIVVDKVWVFPGVPAIFKRKLLVLQQEVRGPGKFYSLERGTRLDEGHLRLSLDATVERFPGVAIGSYPQWGKGDLVTLITFDGSSLDEIGAARDFFTGLLAPEDILV